jgi:hypothetical protein
MILISLTDFLDSIFILHVLVPRKETNGKELKFRITLDFQAERSLLAELLVMQ